MASTTDLSVLKINYLTQAQYDNAKSQGTLNADEIYMTPVSGTGGVEDVEVDGVSVVTDGVAEITMPTVPTKVSQLQNDSGYITGYTETDPTVPSWAKQSSKPSYTASEVGALPASTSIPSKTSDLTNDSNFVEDASYVHTDNNFTSTEKSKLSGIASGAEVTVQADWNVTSTSSDAYIKNKPTIPTVPTNVSAFTNDAGYLTSYTETDPTVPSWAKASSKPSYTASEVGYGSSNVQSALDDLYTLKVLVVSVASFGSLPQTVTNASITADHICLKAELGTPSAQTGDWTVTTSAGSLTLSGSISGSTTAKLYLAIQQ